jgi:hypothetical protein
MVAVTGKAKGFDTVRLRVAGIRLDLGSDYFGKKDRTGVAAIALLKPKMVVCLPRRLIRIAV